VKPERLDFQRCLPCLALQGFSGGSRQGIPPGVHQSLIVKDGDPAAGVLRLGDFLEEIRKGLLKISWTILIAASKQRAPA
jgi:hypothetical protein